MSESVTVTANYEVPIEQVWAVIMDPERLGEWVSIHDSVSDVPAGGLKQGSTFRQQMKQLGIEFEVRWKIEEIEEPRFARWSGTGPAGSTASVTYELSESGDGTRFDYSNRFDPPGGKLGGAASKVFGARAAKKVAAKSLDELDEVLAKGA